MGTRGIIGFITPEGEERLTYNHFDSYPSGIGINILRWLREVDLPTMRDQVAALTLIANEDEKPTPEQRAALGRYVDGNVSTGDDWYSLLRHTQGDLGLTLESGHIIDSAAFALDSLFCEWGYVIDMQRATFDVYRGFQTEPPTEGRWAGAEDVTTPWEPAYAGQKRYFPIQRVAQFSLERLPTDDEFLAIEKAAYGDEDND
jgi:hypothetical protein